MRVGERASCVSFDPSLSPSTGVAQACKFVKKTIFAQAVSFAGAHEEPDISYMPNLTAGCRDLIRDESRPLVGDWPLDHVRRRRYAVFTQPQFSPISKLFRYERNFQYYAGIFRD